MDEKNSLLKIDESRPDVDEFVDVKKRIENLKQGNSSKVQNNPEKKVTSPNMTRLTLVPFRGGRVSPLISRQNLRPPNLQKTHKYRGKGRAYHRVCQRYAGVQKVGTAGTAGAGQTTFGWTKWDLDEKILDILWQERPILSYINQVIGHIVQ